MRWLLMSLGWVACGSAMEPHPDDQDGDGFAVSDGDCDDTDPTVFPGADDAPYDGVDADCDGGSDFDADGDGVDSDAHGGMDCDDTNPSVHPGAGEACNTIDDDCDGLIDDEDEVTRGGTIYYEDQDGDGYGADSVGTMFCEKPKGFGWAERAGDCVPDIYWVFPGAKDVLCDGYDNDCDDATWEAGVVRLDDGDPTTLAAAAEAATDGSVISLCEGRYSLDNTLDLDVEVSVEGAGGTLSRIDAAGLGRAIDITADATLSGLMVANGAVTEQFGRGGGIWVASNVLVELDDVVLRGNEAPVGDALYVEEGAVVNAASTIVDQNGGPTSSIGVVYLHGATFHGNGTTAIRNNGDVQMGWDTKGVTLTQGATLTGVDVQFNQSTGLWISGSADVRDVRIEGNGGGRVVGGVWVSARPTAKTVATLDRVEIVDNETVGVWGAGLKVDANAEVRLTDSEVSGNDATGGSGASGAVLDLATLVSTNTDWGAGTSDNRSGDMGFVHALVTESWDGVASFVCTDVEQGDPCTAP